MKTVVWTSFASEQFAAAALAFGDAVTVDSVEALGAEIADAEVLVMSSPQTYTAKVAELLKSEAKALRWVQLLSSGYDNVEKFGVAPQVSVTNAGDSWSPVVAEHATLLMLAAMRQLPHQLDDQKRHVWDLQSKFKVRSLEGLTLLSVGFGGIGREVAKRARAFGVRVIAVTRSGRSDPSATVTADDLFSIARLLDVLPQADIVALCLPLSPETHHLIGARELAVFRNDAWLVNVSRGGIVDTAALIAALKDGRIGGAALDVAETEPLPADSPLWEAPNLIVTPHVAGFGSQHLTKRLVALYTRNARNFQAGLPLESRVMIHTT